MGMHSQDVIVLMVTDPLDNKKKKVDFETGVCKTCRQVTYLRSSTMLHGAQDDERRGLCNMCYEKNVTPLEETKEEEVSAHKKKKL